MVYLETMVLPACQLPAYHFAPRQIPSVFRGSRYIKSARPRGLEPPTTGSTVRYSNQLSYGPSRKGRAELYIARIDSQGGSPSLNAEKCVGPRPANGCDRIDRLISAEFDLAT